MQESSRHLLSCVVGAGAQLHFFLGHFDLAWLRTVPTELAAALALSMCSRSLLGPQQPDGLQCLDLDLVDYLLHLAGASMIFTIGTKRAGAITWFTLVASGSAVAKRSTARSLLSRTTEGHDRTACE